MTIESEILRAESNLKDCYDACESIEGVVLPDDKNFDNLAACIEQAKNPFNKPSDWSDIRVDCPANSIALYAGELGSNYIIEDGKLIWANPNIYLRSSGTQYIDSGFLYKTTSTIEIGLHEGYYKGSLFGFNTNNSNVAVAFNNGSNIIFFRAYTDVGVQVSTSDTYKVIKFNNNKGYVDNILLYTGGTPVDSTLSTYIFARNINNVATSFSDCKINFVKMYDDGLLVRHFVPVPENLVIGDFTCPSNGMFDIVNQQFYGNAGTGDFKYSKDNISNDYDNLGFTATCIGGYKVFIDGTQYGTTYASGAQCSITWSTSGITTGDIVTTPSLLKAHKIWISPATEGRNITNFHCARVASSGNEVQGVLWAHFNIDNTININNLFANYSGYYNDIIYSITSKNNILKTTSSISGLINQATDRGNYCSKYIEYLPIFNSQDEITQVDLQARSATSNLKTISLFGDSTYRIAYHSFQGSIHLEKIKTKKQMITNKKPYSAFLGNNSLKYLPDIDYSNVTNMQDFLTNAVNLQDTVLDVSAATGLRKIGCYGTSQYFMNGFKGLRVSNEAPFNNTTPPQINVSYTGMDRSALVQLFNDLPTVTGGQIINVTGCTGANDLTADDKTIATAKGWTITL